MVVVVVFFFLLKSLTIRPAEGRLHDAAKPLIYKIFENPAEGRPHVVAKPLIYKIFDNPAEGRTHDALCGTKHPAGRRPVGCREPFGEAESSPPAAGASGEAASSI